MHEMSIIQSMMDILIEEKNRHGLARLSKVVVECGALAGIVVDSLTFAWEALTPESELEGCVLEVREIPLEVVCGQCSTRFAPGDRLYMPCPDCGLEIGHEVVQGKELRIASMEADDDQGE